MMRTFCVCCRWLAVAVLFSGMGLSSLFAQDPKVSNPEPKTVAIIIGGVEYAGYSSEAQNTDGFLDVFYRGPKVESGFANGLSGWTRIRLTSAAQPATNGVVSVISNPTGLTTFNYSSVGQVLDYVFGPSWQLPKTNNWALIADFGAITPLSSQNVPVTYVAPQPGTQECTTLVNRFSPKNGYNPGLSLNTNPNPTTCLAGGYTDVAFANQDRSNFLLKYAAGFRTWCRNPFGGDCRASSSGAKSADAYAAVDATFGQDSSVTGGLLRGVVFKVDGVLPVPTGNNTSWLYLFGSAYVRLRANQNLSPLILQSPASPVTVPSPTVVVLPLVQPNRDYYRLGVGLNINQLWCKTFGSGCSKSDAKAGANPAPSVRTLNPASVPSGHSGDLAIAVIGSNFGTSSRIIWDDTVLSTQYVSPTLLTATVPEANLTKPSVVHVAVSNPAPGGGTSSTTPFQIK